MVVCRGCWRRRWWFEVVWSVFVLECLCCFVGIGLDGCCWLLVFVCFVVREVEKSEYLRKKRKKMMMKMKMKKMMC